MGLTAKVGAMTNVSLSRRYQEGKRLDVSRLDTHLDGQTESRQKKVSTQISSLASRTKLFSFFNCELMLMMNYRVADRQAGAGIPRL